MICSPVAFTISFGPPLSSGGPFLEPQKATTHARSRRCALLILVISPSHHAVIAKAVHICAAGACLGVAPRRAMAAGALGCGVLSGRVQWALASPGAPPMPMPLIVARTRSSWHANAFAHCS